MFNSTQFIRTIVLKYFSDEILTSELMVIGFVIPLLGHRVEVGLGSCVSHGIIGHPGCEVVVEGCPVNDPLVVHQPVGHDLSGRNTKDTLGN